MSEYNFYAEFDNLFVEHELHGLRDTSIEIINVQMYDPKDRENTDKWVDVTGLISDGVRAQLIDQISEGYQCANDMREAAIEDYAEARRSERREQLAAMVNEVRQESLDTTRGVKI